MMTALGKLTFVQTKLYMREPMGVFFTLLFGPVMLIMLGLVFGNEPQAMFGGLGQMDVSVPAYIAVIAAMTGLTSVPIALTTRREAGVLRRFSATPLRPFTYFLTDIAAPFLMTLLGVLILIIVGRFAYNVQFEGHSLSLIAALCLGILAFFSLGYALAGIIRSARVATLVGNVVLFPMMFLSGAFVPLEVMPEAANNASRFLPLTHLVALLRGLWYGEAWSSFLVETAVLVGVLLVGSLIVILTFRWE